MDYQGYVRQDLVRFQGGFCKVGLSEIKRRNRDPIPFGKGKPGEVRLMKGIVKVSSGEKGGLSTKG